MTMTLLVSLLAALIGAFSALITTFLKEVVFQRLNEARSKTNQQREIFRNYAAPLAAATEKLIWRFSEIFLESRAQFLKSATLPVAYNEYKRKSTLYRIACILGWIRAINLELSALPRGASGFLAPVSDAIAKVQSALADGPHVELHRLEQVCAVWNIKLDALDDTRKRTLATQFEVRLYAVSGDALRDDTSYLKGLPNEQKLQICRELSGYLCAQLQRAAIGDAIIEETVNRAISALSYREALIYRDWQDAIGDAMLETDPDSVRRFKVVGYERFEQVIAGTSLWMDVFRNSIVDIDFEARDPNDFRAQQLRDLASGIAKILTSLSGSGEADLVNEQALEVAKKLSLE